MNRRSFLKGALVTAAAGSLSPRSWSQVGGANSYVRVAVVGINGRGGGHISELSQMEGVRIAGLCDVDQRVLEARTKALAKADKYQDARIENYQDARKLLENRNIDAITIATTNHWHSLLTIWACQAGKDVYVEKPCSHNVFEGRKCVEAARQYNRIVQHGTQSRSSGFGRMAAIVKSGKYGKLLVSKGYCCKPRWSIGFKQIRIPGKPGLRYLARPTPKQPYTKTSFTTIGIGSGTSAMSIGNQGVHEIDMARWAIGPRFRAAS